MNVDWVSEQLAHAQVCAINDAAFQPLPDTPDSPQKRKKTQEVVDYFGIVPDASCLQETCDLLQCTTATRVGHLHVSTPFFVQMDQEDNKSVNPCEGGATEGCDSAEVVDAYAAEIRALLATRTGAFSERLGRHVYLTNDWFFETGLETSKGTFTYADIFRNWYFDCPGPKVLIEDGDDDIVTNNAPLGGMCGGAFPTDIVSDHCPTPP